MTLEPACLDQIESLSAARIPETPVSPQRGVFSTDEQFRRRSTCFVSCVELPPKGEDLYDDILYPQLQETECSRKPPPQDHTTS